MQHWIFIMEATVFTMQQTKEAWLAAAHTYCRDLHWGLPCVSRHSSPVPSIRGKALSFLKNISEYSRVLPLTLVKNRARKPSVPANCQGFQSNTFCRLFCLANHSTNKQGNENDGYEQTGKNPVAVQLSTPVFLKFRIITKQGQILSTSEGGQSKQTFTTMSLTLPCSCSAAVCRKGQLILISN